MASKVQEIKKKLQAAQPVTTGSSATAQGRSSGSRVRDIKRKMVADVDGQYIQSFLSDSRDHISNTQREYEGLNWLNARSEEARVSRANDYTNINQRARKVRTYLDAYKEDIPEEQYTALKQYLDDFDAFQNQSAASFRNAYAQFSQFETEDDYRAFTTFQKQLGEDIPAIDQQIADLEAEYETFDWTDASQREKMREYESKISQMKVYRRQAAAVQANKAAQEDLENRLATYSKNADWDKLSKGIDVSDDPDRKRDYSIVFELSRTNVAYDKETALANGTPEAEWNDIDQKRRYIGKKYGVDLYADIYDNGNIFNEIMSMLDDYSFEGGELSQQLWGERIGNSFKNMRHLTEDEQAVLNYIFHTQGRDAALQWHNSRMNIYQDRANGVLTEEMLKWGKEAPLRSSLASVAMSIGSSIEQIGDWISGDYNNSLARASSAIRSGVSEKTDLMIGNWDAFDFLYSTGMSGVDSWAASAFGKAGSVVLGLSAAAQATNDAMDRGMPKKQAFWHGLMSGVFECLFERWSIGNFKALKEVESEYFKDAVKNLAKTMLVNATEEACTEVANIAYDTIVNGDFSQYEAMLLQNVTDGMSEDEAKRNTALQLGGQVAEAAASGALMGFGFGVTGLSQGAMKKASRKVRFNKALKNFENTQLKEFAPLIIAEALDLNPDNAQAMQLKAQLDSGKELSTGDLKALHTLAKESTIAVDSETAANRLKELGETGDVAAISKAAAKQAVGEKLTAAEKKILSQSQYAQQVVEELTKQQEAVFDTAETQPITAQQTNSADTDSMSTPAENVPETPYEVSVDNQTIQKSTGEAVTLLKISSIKNGKMTFRTDAGTEVDAADVSYASEDEAIVYETVAQLCSNASAANLLVDAFHTGQIPGDIYARGIQEAYSYGKLNSSQDDMMKHGSYVKDLTEHQRNVAYKMGQLFAGKQISREVAAIRKHKKSGKKVAGKVHFDGDRSKLNTTQRAGLDAMELLAKGLGIQFYVFESDHNADGDRVGKSGWYDPKDGSIHIDLHAGNDGKGTILFTVAHELTHYIRQWSPAKFKILANYLIKQYGEKGVSVNELIDDQITKAALDNRTIDRDEAFEEMVADSMESMLTSGNVLQMMADVKAQDRALWEKIRDWFKDFAEKLKKIINAYSDVEPDSVEGRLVADMQDVTVILEALYGDALLDAAENFDAETQKNTAEGGVRYSIKRTQNMSWDEQIMGALYGGKNIRRNDTLIVARPADTVVAGKIADVPLAIPLSVLTKASTGKDASHSIKRGKLTKLDEGIKNAPMTIVNPERNAVVFVTGVMQGGLPVLVAFDMNAIFDGDKVHKATSIHLQVDMQAMLENLPQSATVYVQKNELDPVGATNNLRGLAAKIKFVDRIARTSEKVNNKMSSRDPAQQKIQKALEQENAQLKEDVSRLAELLKLQRTVTDGTKFTKTSVEAAARMLKKHANVKRMANTSELAQLLHTFYETVASDTKPSWDKIKEQARPVVQWLQEHVDLQAERSEYAQTILDQIKGSQIYLDESQRAEAEYRFGSYNDFRKAVFGRITLVNEGSTSLDSWWHAMADQFPDVFNPETTSTDMPGELYDIIDQLKNADTSRVEYEYNRASIAMDLTRQVYDSYWRVSTLHTVADRAQDKINELRYKHYRQMTELRTKRDAKIAKIKADNRAALEAHRAKAEKKQREIVEQYQESRARAVDSRKRTEMRHQLHRVVKDIYKLYNRGKDTNNVKEEMKEFVFHALSSAELLLDDLYTDDDMIRNGVGIKLSTEANALLNRAKKILYRLDNPPAVSSVAQLDEWNHQEKKLKLDLSKIKTQLREAFLQERRNQKGDVLSMVMQDLCDAYEELANSKQPHIRNAFRPFVLMHLEGVRKNLKETRVEDMTLDQLTELHEAYTMVLTSIRDANKAFCANRSIDYMAKQLISEFGEQKRSKSKVKNFVRNVSDYAGWNYEKLYYALERIGSATFTQLFTNLANAESIIMEDIADAKAYQRKTVDKYGYNSWDINKKVEREFVDNLGHSFQLTLGEIMLLYAYTRRGNVWQQLATGGFVLEKKSLADDRNVTAYKLTPAQCLSITNTLTEDQKHFVEDMQKYLSDVMGTKGNEVSMQLYGVKLYNDPNYCPVHVAGQYQARAEEATARKQAGFEKLSNAGFTKTKDIEAKATIAMESFMDIWVDHVNEMSRYHGAVPALEDIRRVMNYSDYSDGAVESKSVRAMMENRYGKQAVNYFDNLWREVNSGAVLDKLQSLPKKALSISRKMAVAYSLSVLVQQPSSISRAFAMVDPQYFAGLSGAGASAWGVAKTVTNRWSKKQTVAYAEMVKYAPGVTLAKEIGGFDDSGGGIRNYLMDTEKNLITSMKTGTTGEKLQAVGNVIDDNPIANLPNLADKIAWIEIWNACKREVKDKHRSMDTNSEAFMKLVGRRFTEVIRATQVYDSVFAKSPLLKSKNVAVQYIVSYMNEPNVVANMTESAIRDIRNGGFENFKKGAKKLFAVTRSIIFCNVLKSLIYAMRDDDEDETYIEKYMQALTGNLISDITVINYIPFLRDLWSICKGYDVERPDISIFSDLIFSIEKYNKVKNKDISGMSPKELEEWDRQCTEADWGLIGAIAGCFGIPIKNIYREFDSAFSCVRICGENAGKSTWKTYGNACYQGVVDALPWVRQVSKSDSLYDALAAGDTATVNRLKSTYRDKDGNFNQSAYHSAVRKGLRKNDIRIQKAARARIAGDQTTANKIMSQIAEEGFFDYSDISAAVKAEYNDLKTN